MAELGQSVSSVVAAQAVASQQGGGGRRWWRRVTVAGVGFCVLVVGLYFCRGPVLRGAARWWIVNEPVTRADAIVVLGGGMEYRPFAAARLLREGVAPRVLVAQPELAPTAELGLTMPEFAVARCVLLSNGVPASAIEALGTNVMSTRDEALALKTWLTENHATSVVIPTEVFHTRRARWIFSKVLRGTGVEVHVIPVEQQRYQSTNWWQHEEGLVAFQNEIVKSVYYQVRY